MASGLPTDRCESCPLADRPSVSGVGRDEARYVIIGEAPGKHEVMTGVPFTGDAGKELKKALTRNRIDRNRDAFVTNTVLCHPTPKLGGADSRPTSEAIRACLGRLIEEIKSHNPEAVLALGVSAAQTLLESHDGIQELREKGCQESSFFDQPVVVTVHPASRVPNRLEVITADIAKLIECGAEYRRANPR
jgi:DNA polymerase